VHVVKAGEEAVISLGSETMRPWVRENFGMKEEFAKRVFYGERETNVLPSRVEAVSWLK
jgi:hypothetical protein